eukprot:TRINITY_DN14347_c0_g1_i1.p1 TRINITY_DN14347_c0_g1~~TRINITY_DN14347_c0_g1_i1.p1  ORF type:complete len:485 (-),score=27.41 TRINITY_DN14347_c0_g1_i1:63-1493(-)
MANGEELVKFLAVSFVFVGFFACVGATLLSVIVPFIGIDAFSWAYFIALCVFEVGSLACYVMIDTAADRFQFAIVFIAINAWHAVMSAISLWKPPTFNMFLLFGLFGAGISIHTILGGFFFSLAPKDQVRKNLREFLDHAKIIACCCPCCSIRCLCPCLLEEYYAPRCPQKNPTSTLVGAGEAVNETVEPAVTKLGGSTLTEILDSPKLELLQALLTTQPDWLGRGRDVSADVSDAKVGSSSSGMSGRCGAVYSKLVLVKAWHVKYEMGDHRYTLAKQEVQDQILQLPNDPPSISLKTAGVSTRLDLPLQTKINECIALHGTSCAALKSILSYGLKENFSTGGAFGDGTYLAEDAGKCDQYCDVDEQRDEDNMVHKVLYPAGTSHPGDVSYILVCNVVLGWPACTLDGMRTTEGGELWSNAATKRELATIPHADLPIAHHGLIVEVGQAVKRYREILSFHSDRIAMRYLIAYRRAA